MKKFLIFASIVVVIAVIAIIIIIILGNKKQSAASNLQAIGGLKDQIYFPHLAKDGNSFYYFGDKGVKLKKYNLTDNTTEIIYPEEILYTIDTIWSPDDSKLIIINNDSLSETPIRIFDLETKKFANLDKKIKSAIWAPDSSEIYFQYFNGDESLNYLGKEKIFTNVIDKLFDVEYLDYGLIWLNNGLDLGYWSKPSDVGGTNFLSYNLESKQSKEIFNDYRLGGALASPDGQYLAYIKYSTSNNGTLSIAKSDGSQDKDFEVTPNLKNCIWSNDNQNIFCTYQKKSTESDVVIKININNNLKEIKYSSPKDTIISTDNLLISPDNKILYISSNDVLYSLEIN